MIDEIVSVFEGGDMIGHAILKDDVKTHPNTSDVAIRKGCSTEEQRHVIEEIMERLKQKGATHMAHLHIRSNTAYMWLWNSLGFKEEHIDDNYSLLIVQL